jgi:NAD(P)-dependent dehydrogenase (short-subunit alcohol dehydrogenase family)
VFVNAGIGKFVPFDLVDEAQFDEIFNTNIKGAFFTIQKLLPVLKDGSSIVLNASAVVNAGFAATSVYTASKAALNSLAKTLSKDLLPRKIRVNTVNPGPIVTPIFDKLGLPEEAKEAMKAGFTATVPVGRFGDVREITGYVAFLLSDQSTFVLGTELSIDGGATQL